MLYRSKLLPILVTIIPTCLLARQAAQSNTAPEERPSDQAIRLLRAAVASAEHFPAEERADLLLDASRAALNLERGDAAHWALELFGETQKMTPGHYRAAMQKNALVTLAQVDPLKAADMYTLQDDPPQPRLPEDIRAYGTQVLFPALWSRQGLASLDRIKQISVWLGSTGEYPYAAIGGIVKDLNAKNPEMATDLFMEAVSYLGRGPEFAGTPRHYVDFLLKTWTIPPSSALRVAIQKGLDMIERAQEQSRSEEKKTFHFYQLNTSKGPFEIHSEWTYLVYRLSVIAAAVDPHWPAQIREHFSELANLPSLAPSDPVTVAAAVSPDGSGSADVASALGQSLAMQLPAIAQTDPQRAMDEAYKIGDPTERFIAIASILPAYARISSSDQLNWLTRLQKIAEAQPPGEAKLRLLVQLAQDQFAMQKERDGLTTASHAFDLGEELFAAGMQANPGKMAYTMPGFDPLLDLCKAMAALPAARADGLDRVMHIKDEILQARMQIAFAAGIRNDVPTPAAAAINSSNR